MATFVARDTADRPAESNIKARQQEARHTQKALSVQEGYATTPKDLHWLEGNIPCQAACPAGTDIPGYIEAIFKGDYENAYRINLRDNVFPHVLGRVCARPCEPMCRHGWEGNGEPVAICHSKRAAGDQRAKAEVVRLHALADKTGKKVAVIGGGVAGLTAAREIARMGHRVTVYEKHSFPGGMMNQGIPVFRLPRDLINREIEQVRACGVEILCGVEIGKDMTMEALLANNDAIVMAAGTLKPNIPDIPGKDLDGVEHGLNFLLDVNEKGRRAIGKRVVVIGGGYTSMDCARTAIRLGAKALKVYYRRREKELLILPEELVQLREEGGWMEFSCNPIAFLGEDGKLTGIRFVRTREGEPDSSGRRRAVAIPGSEFEVDCDHVIMATGQFSDLSWVSAELGREIDEAQQAWQRPYQTAASPEKIFFAGDFITGASTLIQAIGHAKGTARAVDTYLMGAQRIFDAAYVQPARATGRDRQMDFLPLNHMPTIPCGERTLVAEVESGFKPIDAHQEASRCYLCHYKFEIDDSKCVLCDECLYVKPKDKCIVAVTDLINGKRGEIVGYNEVEPGKTSPLYYSRLYIDQTQCIRCGACEKACPTGAISIQKVSRVPATAAMMGIAERPCGAADVS